MLLLLIVKQNFALGYVLVLSLALIAQAIHVLVKRRVFLVRLRRVKLPQPEPVLPYSSRVALATFLFCAAIFLLLFVWQHRIDLIH